MRTSLNPNKDISFDLNCLLQTVRIERTPANTIAV